MLFRSVRMEVHAESVNPYDSCGEDRYLFSVWHDSALMAAFGGKHQRTVALTSRHRDGRLAASIVAGVGVKTVRGSSGRSGQRAARQLMKVAEKHDIVITPDGPRGPRRTMSRGIVYLASKTGSIILPSGFACNNAWDVKGSWTSLTIPKPFSRVALFIGKPIRVPDCVECELDEYKTLVQQAMDALQVRAVRQVVEPQTEPLQAVQNDHFDKVT